MKRYEVSIITPLHNVGLHMFKRTIESVKNQTLGFENIEWVVVIHNSAEEYERQVLELLKGYENVRAEILHDSHNSPSSPRNMGLDLATGEYIGILDGDDMYTPDCLKTALRHIKRTGADICVFRREVELESETSLLLNEVVLWDQTREEIVVNRDNWDGKKIFCGMWGMVTHKLYRADFIKKNNLRFDPSIEFAEDCAFSVNAYGKAGNICLLPQLIGYVYFVNSASGVQSGGNENDARLLRFAEGFKKICDTLLHYGFYADDTIAHLLMFEGAFMLKKGNVAEEVRRKIFELLTPYAKVIKPLEPSKLYPPRQIDDLNNMVKYFLSDENASEISAEGLLYYDKRTLPETVQDYQIRALYNILENGGKSDYGLRYDFSDISTTGGYRSLLPLTNYDMYQPMIDLARRIDESSIFTDENITGYMLSYGRVGVPKRLPVTQKHLAPYLKEMERMLSGKKVFFMAESLRHRSPVLNLDTKYTSTLTGLILSEFYNDNLRVSLSRKRADITTPAELLFPDELMELEYPRLFFALREKDITTIYAPNAGIFLDSMHRLAKDWEKLCDDIEAGRISELKRFPDDKRKKLNSRIAPDPERAKELRKIFTSCKDGNILPLVKDIWPSLVEIIADGTGSNAIYADIIRDNMRHIKFNNNFLATEEAFIARSVPNTDMYELDLSANFYEFMPLTGGETVAAHELEPGGEYRVIVSGYSGLYRYCTNVLVRCEEVSKDTVTVSKLCPRDYDIQSMEGITEEKVYSAVKMFVRKSDIQTADYIFIYDGENESYSLVLEPAYSGDNFKRASEMSQSDKDDIAKECANILGTSKPVRILFNEPGTHALHTEMIQYRRKILQDAIRPYHVADDVLDGSFFLKLTV